MKMFQKLAFLALTMSVMMPVPAQEQGAHDCLSKLPAEAVKVEGSKSSLYVGAWPAVKLCQALVIKSGSEPNQVLVTYVYEAGKYPGGFLSITATVSAEGNLTFSLPWRTKPKLTYNLATGEASFEDISGLYPGYVSLRTGPGVVPFSSKP